VSEFDRYLVSEAAQGLFVESGQFQVLPEKALGKFALPEPGLWVLKMVQAAVAAGPEPIGDVDNSRYQALQRLHRYLTGDGDKNTKYHCVRGLRRSYDRAFYCRTEKFGSFFSRAQGHDRAYGQVRFARRNRAVGESRPLVETPHSQ
jgi:hypothetical protein